MGSNPIKHTSQAIDNWSFDETYKQAAVEQLVENAAGTALVRQKQILTAGDYDAVEVDTSADPIFTITKKLGAATVDTKTITII